MERSMCFGQTNANEIRDATEFNSVTTYLCTNAHSTFLVRVSSCANFPMFSTETLEPET